MADTTRAVALSLVGAGVAVTLQALILAQIAVGVAEALADAVREG